MWFATLLYAAFSFELKLGRFNHLIFPINSLTILNVSLQFCKQGQLLLHLGLLMQNSEDKGHPISVSTTFFTPLDVYCFFVLDIEQNSV
jgi:hypothetical protein